MRVVLWGTYDTGKPRTRMLCGALRAAAIDTIEIHSEIWSGVEDKSQLKGLRVKVAYLLRWLAAYPGLVIRYLRAPAHDAVVVGYLGHLDVLVLWPFARMRGKPIVWDAFLSLYDTVVQDRRLVGPRHPVAWMLRGWEWLACRAATRVVLDTEAHAGLFRQLYGLSAERTAAVFVGSETNVFAAAPAAAPAPAPAPPPARAGEPEDGDGDLTVLFYGQFIPLHGIETIVRAAQAATDRPYRWVMIGGGQEESRIRALIGSGPRLRLDWIPWVRYDELIDWIVRADVCLGIFGATGKAARVIPNKVFQIVCAGRPLITRDSPAVRELLDESMPGVYLVPPADPEALLAALEKYRNESESLAAAGQGLHGTARRRFTLAALGADWRRIAAEAIGAGAPTVAAAGARR